MVSHKEHKAAGDVRREIKKRFEKCGIERAGFETDQLMMYACNMNRSTLILCSNTEISDEQTQMLAQLAERRESGEPLQYILGEWEFFSLPFKVGPGVLIPRADTETLVNAALDAIKARTMPRVIDLCAGSGCVAAAIANERRDSIVTAVEFYDEALSFLNQNIAHCAPSVNIVKADVLEAPDGFEAGTYDLIVSNPPYIESEELPKLMREVKKEPQTALDGGADGLTFYRSIVEKWTVLLKDGGCIAVEIGAAQAGDVCSIFTANQIFDLNVIKDTAGLDRVIVGTLKRL